MKLSVASSALTQPKWFTLFGGVLLTVGVITAVVSARYSERVMGEARNGVVVLAPEPDSPEWKEKTNLPWWADFWFYTGIGLTSVGGLLQMIGGILPLESRRSRSGFHFLDT